MAAMLAISCSAASWVQTATAPQLQSVAQLSANGSMEVQQDLLTITLNTSRDGGAAQAMRKRFLSTAPAIVCRVAGRIG